MMEVRWGFVGAGNVTEAKASPSAAFTQEGSRVVAVARADKGRAEAYARANGIARAYGSVEELCADSDVNAVYVCTPHHLHKEHALAAIRAGKHVLCEKPLAITTEDCLAIVREAERAGVVLSVPYYRRFYPVVEKLAEVVRSGRLGTLTSANLVAHGLFLPPREEAAADARTGWRTRLETAGGGSLNENGSHRIDLLFWLLGEARSVSAMIERVEAWYEGEDQANVTIRFANRAIAQFDQSWCTRTPRDSFAIFGTQGEAIIDDLEGTRLRVRIGQGPEEIVEAASRAAATHAPVVADFVRALNTGGRVRCSGADALLTSQLIELAYVAAREGRTVDVPVLAVVS
ncbi:MAG: Gfo/Idh/MocA family oxidoreductase [Chloroflexota bacterium]|nr:Gfo/Idh/MocA family oxidoreductase [Chloroflexota bacterium]